MNPEVKYLWVAALRSGEFIQGRGHLKYNEKGVKHCCLGVLCEIHSQNTGERFITDESIPYLTYLGKSGNLPQKVMDWAGLNKSNPLVEGLPLTVRNDSGESFVEIADVIEKGL